MSIPQGYWQICGSIDLLLELNTSKISCEMSSFLSKTFQLDQVIQSLISPTDIPCDPAYTIGNSSTHLFQL